MKEYDRSRPWNKDVLGTQSLPLINDDADTIRVEAGPGTGKTFGLVRRVQRLLHPDGLNVSGRDVLVVAFNRVIAKDLAEEIEAELKGMPHDGDPEVRTVHGLCLDVIGPPLRMILPTERECMIYDCLERHDSLRSQYRDFEMADQALRDHEAGHVDHTALWQAARDWLHQHQAQLVSDLPRLLLERLKEDDVPDRTFQHVIIDEFQDLTAAEQELFLRLRRSGGQLVALGDRKQSIYRFRGNAPEGLAQLTPGLHGIASLTDLGLRECTRCPSNVVAAANQLMSLEGDGMVAGRPETGAVHVVVWKSVEAEAAGMAGAIAANIAAQPVNHKHLAMVSRRRFGFMLRDKLAEVVPGLAVDLSFSEGVLDTWPAREAFLYLSLRVAPDAPSWRAWLGYQNPSKNRGPLASARNAAAYLALLHASHDEITGDVLKQLAAEPREKRRGSGGSNVWDRAVRFADLSGQIEWPVEDAGACLESVFDPNKWNAQSDEEKASAALDMGLIKKKALERLAELPEEWTAERKMRAVVETLRYHIATREPFESKSGSRLKITTLWGAKGVTADHVAVVGLCAEALPGERRPEYPGTNAEYLAEQKRLFYVSLTRAKKTLVLSRAKGIHPWKARPLGLSLKSANVGDKWAKLDPTPFLRDIQGFLPDAVRGEAWAGI